MEEQMTEVNGLSGESRGCADPIYHIFYTHDLVDGDLGRSDVSYRVLSSDGACWRRIYINESSFLAVTDRLLRRERYPEDADRLRVLTLLDDMGLDDLLNTYPNAGQNVTLTYTSRKK